MNDPRWRHVDRLDPDPLHVEPEPVRRAYANDLSEQRSCSLLALCVGAITALLLGALIANSAAPRPGPDPTTPQPGVSAASGSVSVSAPVPAGASGPGQSGAPLAGRKGRLSAGAPIYRGTATFYCSTLATCTRGYRPGDLIGAIDRKDSEFRPGDRVTVRAFGRAVTVTIVDTCACAGTRLIDLSRAAFARLANPDLGVIPVTLELAGPAEPLPTGPRTDMEAPRG